MEKFIGCVFLGEGKYRLEERSLPDKIKDNEVIIEVEASGICGTDIHILSVPPGHPANKGIIMGHEYTGRIVEVGKEVKGIKVGDRVVVDPNITCGYCHFCRKGHPNLCVNMTTLGIFIDGGFAKYNVAPYTSVHKIPSDLSPEEAVFAEPLSCVVNAVNKIKLTPGESVCVLGAGPMGLLLGALLKKNGASKLIMSEPQTFRHKFAKKIGADIIINPKKENLEERIKDEFPHGVDVVVDAVGVLFEDALKIVSNGGRILLLGMNEQAKNTLCQYYITRKEIQIIGSFISHYSFPQTIEILSSHILDLKSLITHTLSLSEIEKGFSAMREKTAIKVIINKFE